MIFKYISKIKCADDKNGEKNGRCERSFTTKSKQTQWRIQATPLVATIEKPMIKCFAVDLKKLLENR